MASKKIFILLPDGIGLRNFAFTNFYKIVMIKVEFTPPIKERSTNDLLKIVGSPEKWNPIAFL